MQQEDQEPSHRRRKGKGPRNGIIHPPEILERYGESYVVGWKEWVSLPDLSVGRILAKLDTGARTSALHAPHVEVQEDADGSRWVLFDLDDEAPTPGGVLPHKARLVDEREVRSSSGHVEQRLLIRTTLRCGRESWEIEVTLTDRSDMKVPMLIGRSAMHGRLIVDASRSFLAGRRIVHATAKGKRKSASGPETGSARDACQKSDDKEK